MTLATHILVAGAVAKPFIGRVNGLFIFIISIFSHYLADAIPHFDYKLLSIKWNEEHKKSTSIDFKIHIIVLDLLNIAIDIAIGSALLFILVRPEITFANFVTYGLIILGGILPDALQPIFILWKRFPMNIIQDIHDFWHSKLRLTLNKAAVVSQATLFILAAYINSIH